MSNDRATISTTASPQQSLVVRSVDKLLGALGFTLGFVPSLVVGAICGAGGFGFASALGPCSHKTGEQHAAGAKPADTQPSTDGLEQGAEEVIGGVGCGAEVNPVDNGSGSIGSGCSKPDRATDGLEQEQAEKADRHKGGSDLDDGGDVRY